MKTLTAEVEVLSSTAEQANQLPAEFGEITPAETASLVARSHTGQPRFKVGRDALDFAGLTEAQRADVEWLWVYCHDRNLGTEEIGKLILKGSGPDTYSYESIYQLWTGRRVKQQVNVAPMCEAIAAFRRKVDAKPVHNGYVKTRMANQIQQYALLAQKRQLVGYLVGRMTVGKTTPLDQLARENPSVIYTRMPTAGTRARLLEQLAAKLGMGTSQSIRDLSQRVIDAFKPHMLLIVDEADQAFSATKISAGLSTLDFLRELWDTARCGILLVMDDEGRNQFQSGVNRRRLGRLYRRRLPVLNLPDVPYEDDLALFAASYGLPPAPVGEVAIEIKSESGSCRHKDSPRRLQDAVVAQDGLLIWLSLLEQARDTAAAAQREVTWGAVLKAHAAMAASEA